MQTNKQMTKKKTFIDPENDNQEFEDNSIETPENETEILEDVETGIEPEIPTHKTTIKDMQQHLMNAGNFTANVPINDAQTALQWEQHNKRLEEAEKHRLNLSDPSRIAAQNFLK